MALDTQQMETPRNPMNRPQNPSVAVIILNWNGEDLLRRYLPAAIANTPPDLATIIVADNGSTDGSLSMLRKRFPSVRIISFPENLGFAEGYNRAIAEAGYEYTVLLNSDAAPTPGWLPPMLECLRQSPDIAACQPKILSMREEGMFEYAGAAGGFLDRHGYPYCRGRIFSTVEPDNGQYDSTQPTDIFWASGAALMVRTSAYQAVGGLDSRFFAHMEEIDLCWRMHLAGYRVVAVTSAAVRHLGGASLSANDPRKTYLNFRNNLLMMHKNLPASVRTRRLFVRRLLDTIAWSKAVATLRWSEAAAIWRAHRHFARMRSDFPTLDNPDAPDLLTSHPNRPLSILAAYFLRRHTTFPRL